MLAVPAHCAPFRNNPVGYVVAGWAAADQLRAGRSVVADAVNNVAEARQGWMTVARDCSVPVRFVEIICSDEAEHRRRAEMRSAQMPGHGVPTWAQVQWRPWEPIRQAHLVVDNVGDPAPHAAAVIDWLAKAEH